MKNRIGFIMPRLVGATVLIGLASFVLMTVFKLLVGAVIVGGIIAIAGRAATRREQLGNYYQGGIQPYKTQNFNSVPVAVSPFSQRSTSTIIPIN